MPKLYYILLGLLIGFLLLYISRHRTVESFDLTVFPSTPAQCTCPSGYVASQEMKLPMPEINIYRADLGFQGVGIFLYGYPGEKELYTVHNDLSSDTTSCCYYVEEAIVSKMNADNKVKGLPDVEISATTCNAKQSPSSCSSFLTKNPESYVKLFEHTNGIYEQVGFLPSAYYNYMNTVMLKSGFVWVKDIKTPDKNSPYFKKPSYTSSKTIMACKNSIDPSNVIPCQG